jgi:hypothetical protein
LIPIAKECSFPTNAKEEMQREHPSNSIFLNRTPMIKTEKKKKNKKSVLNILKTLT